MTPTTKKFREMIDAAVLAEREACEALCLDHIVSTHGYPDGSFKGFVLVRVGETTAPHTGWAYAHAIRARTTEKDKP